MNTTELPSSFQTFSWILNGAPFNGNKDQLETTNGSLQIGTRLLPVVQDYITSISAVDLPVRCDVVVSDTVLKSNNATLIAYGEIDIYVSL